MRITKRQLRQIIKEEESKILKESRQRRNLRHRINETGGFASKNMTNGSNALVSFLVQTLTAAGNDMSDDWYQQIDQHLYDIEQEAFLMNSDSSEYDNPEQDDWNV